MASPCDLPGVGAVCGLPGAVVSSVAGDAFQAAVDQLATGLGKALTLAMTFWTRVQVPALSDSSGPVGDLRGSTAYLTGAVAVAALLVAAVRLAFTRSSEPAVDAARGLVTLVVATGVGVPAVVALAAAGDGFSTWILGRAGGGALGPRLAGLATSLGPLGPGLVFIVAILGIFAALAQVALMLVRVGVLVMLTGVLPLVAAGSGTRTGRATLTRVLSWLLAFVLYKPAAAVVYASAFYLVGQGSDPLSVLSGLALMVLSIVALPALLRLLTPAVAAATSGGGGGGAVAAGAVVAATGARIVSQRTPAGGGAGSAGGSAGPSPVAGTAAGPSGAGPTGGPGTKGGGPAGAAAAGSAGSPAAAGAGAGSTGAGGAGAVLAVAGAAKTAAKGAADATTELGGGS